MTLTANYFNSGPSLPVRVENGVWWTTCPGCPNWSCAADSWDDLFRLVSEWHATHATHRAWHMVTPVLAPPPAADPPPVKVPG